MMQASLRASGLLSLLLAAGGLVACSGGAEPAGAAGKAASSPVGAASGAVQLPPVGVSTLRAERRDLPVQVTTTGIVTPLSSVDVRAQVTSMVVRVHVKEGQFVKAGELLFTLDSRTDESNLVKAQAQQAKDEASLADARRQLSRSRELLAQGFVSQGAVDASQAQVDAQAAAVAADRAAVEAARVALSYSRITSPGAGRVGSISVFPGSVVQANQTPLVTVTQLSPVGVAFNLPQRQLADALAALNDGGGVVTATLPDKGGRLNGRLDFVDNAVDASSGTVKVKARFDNPANLLWPGAFVNVAMTVRTLKDAVVVPLASIVQTARATQVYAVREGKAVAQPVQVLYAQGEDAAVSGVSPGDRIVLDGRQNLRPGSPVVERGKESGSGKPGPAASGPGSAPPSAPESVASAARQASAP